MDSFLKYIPITHLYDHLPVSMIGALPTFLTINAIMNSRITLMKPFGRLISPTIYIPSAQAMYD